MKKNIYTLFLVMFTLSTFAQQHKCDDSRYTSATSFNIDSVMNVQYGQNTTMNGVLQHLEMDVYRPTEDRANKRPLIIFIHGGGFTGGYRQYLSEMARRFATKGFVTATISYRLIDIPPVDSLTIAEGIVHAVSDAKAAVRFFVADAAGKNDFKVDTNLVFMGGGSAGAITAAQVAYLDPKDKIPPYFSALINKNGGFQGNSSTNTKHTVSIKGVLNYSGALWRSEWISKGEAPLYSFHDELDPIVTCNRGLSGAFTFPIYLSGSCAMKIEADKQRVYNQIFIYPGNKHGGYMAEKDKIFEKSLNFLHHIICTEVVQ
jgi:acetyl esterase/lipase